jgi:hypothetical protein
VAAAVQYVSQLGADEPSAARREKILKGVGNLLQSKVLFRMSDSDDADRHTQIFRSVYETMVRADPTSRARMPFDPARMQTLRDHHALVSLVSTADATNGGGLVDGGHGASRLPAFVTETYAMPELDEIPDRWREQHLVRQREVFTRYPEDMSSLAVTDVLAGLDGGLRTTEPSDTTQPSDAREVAEETVGRRPEVALRDTPPAAGEPARRQEPTPRAEYDPSLFQSGDGQAEKPGAREYDERLFTAGAPQVDRPHDDASRDAGLPESERVGGVRIERAEEPENDALVGDSPVLRVACRPTGRPLPVGDLVPVTDGARGAVHEAATFEAISRLPEFEVAGDDARRRAAQAANAAREQALTEREAAGDGEQERRRNAERRARRAAAEFLGRYGDAPWRTPVKDLELSEPDAHTLELIARLRFVPPATLTQRLSEPAQERAVRGRLARLHDAGVIARSEVVIEGRRGRRPRLYAVAPRGLEYLRLRHGDLRPEQEPPTYLHAERKMPNAGRGREVPHELAIQLTLVALRQYGARVHWHTTRMPGGRWDVGMIHEDRRDRGLRLTDLAPAPGLTVFGERLDAPPTLEPDLSAQLQGRDRTERAVIDLLVEVDRTGRGAYNASKFTAYDHFLGGWCLRTRHWGRERRTRPVVVFVAHSPKAMLALLSGADQAMTLGFGGRGRYEPAQFAFPGRAHSAFTCLDWLLAGRAIALRLPPLPPPVRGEHTELRPEPVSLLPEDWWPAGRVSGS